MAGEAWRPLRLGGRQSCAAAGRVWGLDCRDHWLMRRLCTIVLRQPARKVLGCIPCSVLLLLAGAAGPGAWMRWMCCWRSPKLTWLAAYIALKHRLLDRVSRHFEWRLLHGAVRCGAATVHWCPDSSRVLPGTNLRG
jgi:hypothetical protein